MARVKELSKLHYKVRRQTGFVNKHSLHNTLPFDKQVQPDFDFKQKGKANNFAFHFLNLYIIKARTRIVTKWTRQTFCAKTNRLLQINYLKKLNVSTDFYKKYKIKFLFTFLNTLPFIPVPLRHSKKMKQPEGFEIGKTSRLFLTMYAQKWVQLARVSIPLIHHESFLYKYRLGLNTLVNDKVLTLRSSNSSFQKREKYRMIRPLLDFKRETITMVCKDFQMPVYPDQSNRSVQYLRNRIRRQIIPSLKYFGNVQVENSLFRLAELLNKEQFFLYSILRNTSANVPL